MGFFDTGIDIEVIKENDKKTYTFSGFEDRNEVYESLDSIWQATSPHALQEVIEENKEESQSPSPKEKKEDSTAADNQKDVKTKEPVQPPETGAAKATYRT